MKTLYVTALICGYIMQARAISRDEPGQQYFNLWVAEIHGGEEVAKRVARDQGFNYRGPAAPFENYYEFTRDELPEVSSQHSEHFSKRLMEVEEVKWTEQQRVGNTVLKGNIPERSGEEEPIHSDTEQVSDEILEDHARELKNKVGRFDTISKDGFSTEPADQSTLNEYSGPTKQGYRSLFKSRYLKVFNDPLWKSQWYLQDYRKGNSAVLDHNVVPVWEMGYTGEGMTVMVLDEPIETDHPDLKDNFLENLSYDFCTDKDGAGYAAIKGETKDHGTECAGAIAMVADNEKCGVGIAYNAKIAGASVICMLASEHRDAKALVHNLEHIDVYTNSWGPTDDGIVMDKIGRVKANAIETGTQKGRKGKGSIYLFPAGNGKHEGDNCAADGTINHIGVMAIGSASETGTPTFNAERCSAVFAVTYSGNHMGTKAIISSTEGGGCTYRFSGTSASTPLAAGIITLVLQSKPELTYRDVMHLIAMTAEVAPVANNPATWYRNARGIFVSNDFGFGLLNAENMVLLAKNWKTVPEQKTCTITLKPGEDLKFRTEENQDFFFDTKKCKENADEDVQYLENVELISTIQYPIRGALEIYITSPAGTRTLLLQNRLKDKNKLGLNEQNFKSVHTWGEDPRGTWKVSVQTIRLETEDFEAVAQEFVLKLHGTSEKPDHYNQPRKYAAFRLPDGTTPWTT